MSLFKPARLIFGLAGLMVGFTVLADDVSVPASAGLAPDIVVNGQPISENHVTLMTAGFDTDKNGRNLNAPDARVAARTELITEELLAQEARKSGLDKKPVIADQLAFQSREILSRAYLEDYFAKNPVTDATLKSSYEFNRANGKIVEFHVRQVLVQTSAQAREIIDKLGKGSDFAELAKQYTQDPGGQSNGGDLGWFRPDIFIDHYFSDAVAKLKKGEYTKAPVRTRFGWHVIKIEDGPRAVANPSSYDALDDNAKQALRQKAAQISIENLTARLTANAKISGPGALASNAKSSK
ncbi:MAG: peptidylprolyl isomerase [Nevskia sp.]|nr:peptidylprolyl isomerase [Nevskia sp.]